MEFDPNSKAKSGKEIKKSAKELSIKTHLGQGLNGEELIHVWQSRLDSLYVECLHFWGELEHIKEV